MVSVQNIPEGVYGGLVIEKDQFHISCLRHESSDFTSVPYEDDSLATIISALNSYADTNQVKFISIGVCGDTSDLDLFSKLWLTLDIVPLQFEESGSDPKTSALQAAEYAKSHFDKHNSFAAIVGEDNEVETPPLVSLPEYEAITPPDEFHQLKELTRSLENTKITFISATPQGGGVAIMRHAMLRLFDLLGVNASWHVMEADSTIFDITKRKFHNVLQNVHLEGLTLTNEDKSLFDAWSQKNADVLEPVIKKSDVIVIDDPQPSGLVPYIHTMNPNAKVVFRSHIQLLAELANSEGTAQHITWQFIWEKIKDSDMFITHPVDEFVPLEIPKDKLKHMPPSTDPLDGLNKELSEDQKSYYTTIFNNILSSQDQVPMDPNRPYIIQIARFDPSKGIPDVVEAYAKLRDMSQADSPSPQLAIVGNSSVDDPDGKPIYDQTMDIIRTKYSHYADDIKVVRAPHYDQLLNALLRKASIALQLSHKEGYEFKITEAIMKGIPTIIYDVGGMPLQVQHNITGYVVEKGDTTAVAQYMFDLLNNQELYRTMSLSALQNYAREATTVPNALKWLEIANKLVHQP